MSSKLLYSILSLYCDILCANSADAAQTGVMSICSILLISLLASRTTFFPSHSSHTRPHWLSGQEPSPDGCSSSTPSLCPFQSTPMSTKSSICSRQLVLPDSPIFVSAFPLTPDTSEWRPYAGTLVRQLRRWVSIHASILLNFIVQPADSLLTFVQAGIRC